MFKDDIFDAFDNENKPMNPLYLQTLILLRGLPGSGKSTLATVLSEGGKYPVYAIDDFFTNAATGEYQFDFAKNHLAYQQCIDQTEQALANKTAKVFVANTFTMDWEMEPYLKLASKYDYSVFVVTVEKYHEGKNIHGTSDDQLLKMAAKYQVKLL